MNIISRHKFQGNIFKLRVCCWFIHGGSKEKEKQLCETAVFSALIFSARELQRMSVTELVFDSFIRRFNQKNLLSH